MFKKLYLKYIKSFRRYNRKKFATDLFNYWGIGKEGMNNGVLFLVVFDNRRIEIEIGKGLSNILAPPTIQNILTTEIIPLFQDNNFDRGILNGVSALISRLDSSSPLIVIMMIMMRRIY